MTSKLDILDQLKLVLKADSSDRRIVCIEETDTAKGDVVLSFYMWYAFTKTDSPVCMVGVRDTYGHYQNIGLKFNYNLLLMSNKKRFTFVEPDNISVLHLVNCVKELMKQHSTGTLYMIVDDISELLLFNEKFEDIVDFLTFAKQQQRLSLIFGCRRHKADDVAQRLASVASHLADAKVALAPLVTGFSNIVTGTMRITSNNSAYQIEDVSYLYKLVDNGLTMTLN